MTAQPALLAPTKADRLPPLAVAATALVIYAGLLFAPQLLNDGDTYWHIRAGEWMLDHGRVIDADVFSFSAAGRPWHAHEWLAEILMAVVFRAGGWSGVMALTAAAAAAAGAIVAAYARRWISGTVLALTLVLGLACLAPGLLARPHVLSLPLLAAWAVGLLRARDEGRSPSLWLLPLMVVWANLHGSFVFGLALVGPFALEALIEARARPWPTVRAWAVFGVAAVAAAAVTPHGPTGLLFPFQLMSLSLVPGIDEWRPLDLSRPQPLLIALFVALGVFLHRGVRIPALRLLILLGLLYMTFQHQRHGLVLGLLAPLLLARPLAGESPPEPRPAPARLWVGLVLAALLALTMARLATPQLRADAVTTPRSALLAVPVAVRARPVLNEFGYGGYLIFEGVRPFVDGRADMYGDAFLAEYDRAVSGRREPLTALLSRHAIEWTIFHPANPVVDELDRLPGWRRQYSDAFAVVHVRTTPAPPPLRGRTQ